MKSVIAVSALSFLSTVAADRVFTVINKCEYTVWPGMFTDPNVSDQKPDYPTGWEMATGASVTFSVPDEWKAGRIWGRRECDFSNPNGATACVTGSCNGGLECDPNTGTGVPPATVAEWTLSADQDLDYYDVSLVDGFNIPMSITNSAGCPEASCPVDLNPTCPDVLQGPEGTEGNYGCKSACFANLDGNQADSANCCSGSHNTPATCPASGVQYYDFFKSNCPNSYAYAYDESSGTALFTCPDSNAADYTLTFCP